MIGSEGVIARDIERAPQFPDNATPTPPRQWSRREVAVVSIVPDFKVAADEGSYFTGTNATFGTGVAGPSAAAFSATSALLSFLNKGGAPGAGTRTYLDYVRLILTAIPTAGTRFDVGVTADTIARATAGTVVSVASPNTDALDQGAITQVLYNPTVAAAGPNARQIARATVKVGTPVVGDEYLFVFGSVEKAGAVIASTTVAGRYVIPMPPVVLGGGGNQTALLHLWSATSSAAPSFEFEIGLIER
jgi:hypothetical protein